MEPSVSTPTTQSEPGASSSTRNARGVSPTRNCSPGFTRIANPGDHHEVLVHERLPYLVEIVPRTAAEYRWLEQEQRRLSRKQTERETSCSLSTPTGPMRHKRRKRGG